MLAVKTGKEALLPWSWNRTSRQACTTQKPQNGRHCLEPATPFDAVPWYDSNAAVVAPSYEALDPATVHGWFQGLWPEVPGLVLDAKRSVAARGNRRPGPGACHMQAARRTKAAASARLTFAMKAWGRPGAKCRRLCSAASVLPRVAIASALAGAGGRGHEVSRGRSGVPPKRVCSIPSAPVTSGRKTKLEPSQRLPRRAETCPGCAPGVRLASARVLNIAASLF